MTEPALVAGEHTESQPALAALMDAQLAECDAPARLRQQASFVYQRAGIAQRHFELPLSEAPRRGDWYRAVNESAERLGVRVLEQLAPDVVADCDGLVCVSSSHAGFPSLSRVLQSTMGLRADALCFDLGGLGCAGPTHGLFMAHGLVQSGACERVCMLCVDVMGTQGTLRRHRTAPSLGQIVAHCLASDAGAAMIVSRQRPEGAALGYERAELVSQLWPASLDQNDLNACEDNQPFLAVGRGIRTRIVSEVAALFDELEGSNLLLHPGGQALMAALGDAHPELAESIAISSSVLGDHGNVGSSSLLWVVDQALARDFELAPRCTLFALGPGIVSTALTLSEVVR
jgi:alkylresorcinol/alkylpyrone synthase